MKEIGQTHALEVVKEVTFGWYLLFNTEEILLPMKYAPKGLKVREMIDVFVYRDSEDRLIATTLKPYAKLNEFAALEVKDTNNAGAFMDWGLEKDLFVPLKEQQKRMRVGETHVVRVCLDYRTDRLVGVTKLRAFFKTDVTALEEGQPVSLLIYDKIELGLLAIVNGEYSGLLYENELFQPITIGDKVDGFIKKLREDGKIDLTIRKPGMEAVKGAQQVIMDALEAASGSLPYHDKSSPDAIRDKFGMSKKDFKKAIGGLYKSGLIKINPDGISKVG